MVTLNSTPQDRKRPERRHTWPSCSIANTRIKQNEVSTTILHSLYKLLTQFKKQDFPHICYSLCLKFMMS